MSSNAPSRLDRLLALLHSGPSEAARVAAARQLGNIQREHPAQLHTLLQRVLTYLFNEQWETRRAAALALEAIAEAVPEWRPEHPEDEDAEAEEAARTDAEGAWLAFDSFAMDAVLQHGTPLLASGGSEFDVAQDALDNPRERLLRQRSVLLGQLGLESIANAGRAAKEQTKELVGELVGERDVDMSNGGSAVPARRAAMPRATPSDAAAAAAAQAVAAQLEQGGTMSERARNALKRKAKQAVKASCGGVVSISAAGGAADALQQGRAAKRARGGDGSNAVAGKSGDKRGDKGDDKGDDAEDDESMLNAIGEQNPQQPPSAELASNNTGPEGEGAGAEGGEEEGGASSAESWQMSTQWPFEPLCAELRCSLFNPRWQRRHGAALGLRAILKVHAGSAGSFGSVRRVVSDELRAKWRQDCAIRLICVLALDRFGDWEAGDKVTAPVRETTAQALSVLLRPMLPEAASQVADALLVMGRQTLWEVRHSAMLGLKYVLAVRHDLLPSLLPSASDALRLALADPDDDVKGVAAEALGGVAAHASASLDADRIARLLGALWHVLVHLDELTASATRVMSALAAYASHLPYASLERFTAPGESSPPLGTTLVDVVPRVWPFLRHPAGAARSAALTTVARLLDAAAGAAVEGPNAPLPPPRSGQPPPPPPPPPPWLCGARQLGPAIRLLVQASCLDTDPKVHAAASACLPVLLRVAPPAELHAAASPHLSRWLRLVGTPIGEPIERGGLLRPPFAQQAGEAGIQGAAAPAAAAAQGEAAAAAAEEEEPDGAETPQFHEEAATAGMHERGAAVLGALAHACARAAGGGAADGWREALLAALASPLATTRQVAAWTTAEWAERSTAANAANDAEGGKGGVVVAATAPPSAPSAPPGPQLYTALLQLATDAEGVAASSLEMRTLISAMQQQASALFKVFERAGASAESLLVTSWQSSDWPGGPGAPVGEQAARLLATDVYAHWLALLPERATATARMRCEEARDRLLAARTSVLDRLEALKLTLGEAAAEGVVRMRQLPPKLNPVVRALMRAVEGAPSAVQARAAAVLARLLVLMAAQSKQGVAEKVGGNLTLLLTPPPRSDLASLDSAATAAAATAASAASAGAMRALLACSDAFGDDLFLRLPSVWNGIATPLEAFSHGEAKAAAVTSPAPSPAPAHALRSSLSLVCCLAPSLALTPAAQLLGVLPRLLAAVTAHDLPGAAAIDWSAGERGSAEERPATAQDVPVKMEAAEAAQGAEAVKAEVPPSAREAATPQPGGGGGRGASGEAAAGGGEDVRILASRAVAICCDALGCAALERMLHTALPALQPTAPPAAQLGAALCLRAVIATLETRVLPYAALLIAPLVACLSSHATPIREIGASAFGSLMPILPLEPGTANPPQMSAALAERKAAERPFVDQLLGLAGAKPPRYELPVKVEASLRPYQQAGVDWLAFLRRFGLHGILCDDMGLGKTLQTLCVLSAAAHERRELAAKLRRQGQPAAAPLPSLVVCPPTLTGHWAAEAAKFCPGTLSTVQYVGSAAARAKLLDSLPQHELVVMSYDSMRADIAQLSGLRWDYVVLDEGHAIRNAKAKVSIAAKRLASARRLILSGTPLQNHAVELWSLFDFLMPNYLGSQAHFQSAYARPIHASMGARAGDALQLEGEAALTRLHRQVLPFCLRRTKESVLSELPAKLIEDRICELHPVQRALYAAFAESDAPSALAKTLRQVEEEEGGGGGGGGAAAGTGAAAPKAPKAAATHVFTALQYLRRVCNHPLLALSPTHPSYAKYEAQAKADGGLTSLACAPKLQALQQLLHECGIGIGGGMSGGGARGGGGDGGGGDLGDGGDGALGDEASSTAVATHRALVFAQSGAMLDRVEKDLLAAHMPRVTYLRLDGKVPAQQRFALASKFNSDPSIDVMLLTTRVGGLGLNLTGADVVIFLDHDWNPMADLQAMDRAHRIGQTKVVSVYRLITRGTLEDKIMNLQRFKLHVASSVVNQQNAQLATMQTEELLELFQYSPAAATSGPTNGGGGDANGGAAGALTGDDAVGAAEAAAALAAGGGGGAGRKRARDGGGGGGGLKGVLEGITELSGTEQYEEQFDLDRFLSTLK